MHPDPVASISPERRWPSHMADRHVGECDYRGKRLLIGVLRWEDEAAHESEHLTRPVFDAYVVGRQQPGRYEGSAKP